MDEHNQGGIYNTIYNYSTRGELVWIQDNEGNVFSFFYDTLGRKTSMIDPDMGAWSYSYDPSGNLVWQRDNRSDETSFTYDALDRLLNITVLGTGTYNYTYDAVLNGTLYEIKNPYDTYRYGYDQRLRKTSEDHIIDYMSFTTLWGYDSMDRVVNITYPDGEVVNFTYNSQGQVESAGPYLTDVDYNAVEKIDMKRFGNGVYTYYSYRPDNYRLTRILTPTLQDFNYTYDGVGNVLSIGNSLRNTVEYFGYDDLHRLTSAYETGGYNLNYSYSSIGNLLGIRDDVLTYGVGAGPHALTSYQDNTAPNVSFTEGFRENNSYINDASPTIKASLNDNFGNATATLFWRWTNGSWTDFLMSSAGGTLASVSMPDLEEGSYLYYVNSTDSGNNTGSSGTRKITIDTTPPEINLTTPVDNSNPDSVFVHIDAETDEDVVDWRYSRGGSERVPFNFNYLLRYLRGDNLLSVLARDLAGNLGWATSYFNVNVTALVSDPPQIRIFSPLENKHQRGDEVEMVILVVNYNDETFMDGLRITVKDPSGFSQESSWQRVWLIGKDVQLIRYTYKIPEDAPTGRWLIRAEFTEDAEWHASPTSKWFEVV